MSFLPGLSEVASGVGTMLGITPPKIKDKWSKPLGQARAEWENTRTQAMDMLNQGRSGYQSAFNPFMQQFAGMAQPYGQASLAGLAGFSGLMQDPSKITSDPLYQSKLASGTQAIENSAAARGMQLSGANLLNLGNFGSELAASTLDQRLGQFGQMAGMGQQGLLSGLQGMGQIQGGLFNYDQLMQQALYGAAGGIADTYGAQAQAASAAQLGKTNAQAQTQSALLGGASSMGSAMIFAGI